MTFKTEDMSMAPCVVLVPREHAFDEQLPQLLSDRGWSPRLEHDPRMAMAEACLIRRELQVRNAWEEEPMPIPGLIVVEPDSIPAWEAFRAAMVNYVPDIPIWRWNGTELEVVHGALPTKPEVSSTHPPLQFKPAPLSHEEVSMLLHGQQDTEATEPT